MKLISFSLRIQPTALRQTMNRRKCRSDSQPSIAVLRHRLNDHSLEDATITVDPIQITSPPRLTLPFLLVDAVL